MRYKKLYSIVLENFINGYGLITESVKGLEEKKEEGVSRDINFYLRSKNKVNRSVENIVIKNILIDDNIYTLLKWKDIIDMVFEEFKKEEDVKADIINYKLHTNFSEDTISELCNVSDKKVNKTIRDFVTEIILIAIDEKLINLKQVRA